jgi:hypothetical protein
LGGDKDHVNRTISRHFYIPTSEDLELLRNFYPQEDPLQPAWHVIKADLVDAGHDADTLGNREATMLLKLLGKAMQVTPKQRGPKKADHATVQREAGLAAEWKRAHDAGMYKGDFARDNRMKIADLDRLLKRVASRKKPLQ